MCKINFELGCILMKHTEAKLEGGDPSTDTNTNMCVCVCVCVCVCARLCERVSF
jgi:hypothetical protein